MTNILVPTDFSLQSLEVLDQIARIQQRPARIYLLHLVNTPTDIAELMFLRKQNLQRLVPKEFSQALYAYKLKYATKFEHIELKLNYGSHSAIFNGITDNLGIDEIYILEDHTYTLPFPESVNLTKLINRCGIPVYRVESKRKMRSAEKQAPAFFGAEQFTTVAS